MKSRMKIIVFVVVSLMIFTVPILKAEEIPVSVNIGLLGTGSLTVKVKNISDDIDVGLNGLNISPPAGITVQNPWGVSNQYFELGYDVTWNANWGIRIITDNKVFFPTLNLPGYVGIPGAKIGSGEANGQPANWTDGDEILSFGGIIKTSEVIKPLLSQNPSFRIMLGWQVHTNKVAKPAAPHDTPDLDSNTPNDNTDDWKSNWAWVADKSNYVANADGTLKKNPDTSPFTVGQLPINFDNYTMIASGFIGAGLAQHPVMPDANGDGKPDTKVSDGLIAAYIAGKYANKDYPNNADFLAPSGDYKTKIYIELVHE